MTAGTAKPVNVVVGFDGSPDAVAAIHTGANLVPDARAVVAHVWSPPFAAHPAPELWRRAGTVEGVMDLLAQRGREHSESITREGVAVAVAAGWSAEPLNRRSYGGEGLELARLAEERSPEVLIVGARGLCGVRALLGSVSDTVVHYSPVPVLVVPPGDPEPPEHTISGPVLVAHDGSAGADLALKACRSLWPARTIVIARVKRSPTDEQSTGVTVLEPHGVADSARAVADALIEHAASIGAAAIAVGSRGRSARREILLGSVAMATLHHAHRPVLAVPPPNRFETTFAESHAG